MADIQWWVTGFSVKSLKPEEHILSLLESQSGWDNFFTKNEGMIYRLFDRLDKEADFWGLGIHLILLEHTQMYIFNNI